MRSSATRSFLLLLTLGLAVGCSSKPPVRLAGIGGLSWQLVKFQSRGGAVLAPDDKSKYTVAFTNKGNVKVRFDCNQGNGEWILDGPNQLHFGPLSLTRVVCPPGSLHDQMARQWPFIRSYVVKKGRLYLTVAGNVGSYEFEPIP